MNRRRSLRPVALLASVVCAGCGGGSAGEQLSSPGCADAAPASKGDGAAVGSDPDGPPSDGPARGDAPSATPDAFCPDARLTPDARTSPDAGTGSSSRFPIRISANGRYFVDGSGNPFLLAADAPQGMTVMLTVEEATSYFQNRARHGFNGAWINLLMNDILGGKADGSTFDGIPPFTKVGDLSTPNEAFFARADAMLRAAEAEGIVVLLDPIETAGWLPVLRANGETKAFAYGQYLGQRYAGFANILWLNGNDFQSWMDAGDDALVNAVARGIRSMDPDHLQTTELNYNVSDTLDDPTWAAFVDFNCAYTYYAPYDLLYNDYFQRPQRMPSILIESNYEGEQLAGAPHETNAHDIRAQYYWADLAGATGQVYGKARVWNFRDGWDTPENLDSPGAVQNLYLQQLLTTRPWWDLVPDKDHMVLTNGWQTYSADQVNNQDGTYAPAARTSDRRLLIAYMPSARTFTVDMSQLAGASTAQWMDPTTGTYSDVPGGPFAASGKRDFAPLAAAHADGYHDWVLVITVQ